MMSRNNVLYAAVGALLVVVAVLGYQVYKDRKQPDGLSINLGSKGLSVQTK